MDYSSFPADFFGRSDEFDDAAFYEPERMVTHIDDGAIAAVGKLYDALEISGRTLDLMSSWISHFRTAPEQLVVLGMNAAELAANPMATSRLVHDLNRAPTLPFPDNDFHDVVCAVSVDYLTKPLEVFAEIARVLKPGGKFVCTFSNRCFPTKAIRGWLLATDGQRCEIVKSYFDLAGGFGATTIDTRPTQPGSDPLFAVWAAAN